jgi:hypothetical protein
MIIDTLGGNEEKYTWGEIVIVDLKITGEIFQI